MKVVDIVIDGSVVRDFKYVNMVPPDVAGRPMYNLDGKTVVSPTQLDEMTCKIGDPYEDCLGGTGFNTSTNISPDCNTIIHYVFNTTSQDTDLAGQINEELIRRGIRVYPTEQGASIHTSYVFDHVKSGQQQRAIVAKDANFSGRNREKNNYPSGLDKNATVYMVEAGQLFNNKNREYYKKLAEQGFVVTVTLQGQSAKQWEQNSTVAQEIAEMAAFVIGDSSEVQGFVRETQYKGLTIETRGELGSVITYPSRSYFGEIRVPAEVVPSDLVKSVLGAGDTFAGNFLKTLACLSNKMIGKTDFRSIPDVVLLRRSVQEAAQAGAHEAAKIVQQRSAQFLYPRRPPEQRHNQSIPLKLAA